MKEVIAFLYAEAKALKATVNSTIDIRLTYLLTHQLLINFIKSVVAELTMGMLAISSDTDDSQDKEHISVFVLYKTKIANKYRHQLRGWTTIRYNTVD